MTASGTMKIRIWLAFVIVLFSGMAIGFAIGSFVFRGTPAATPGDTVAIGAGEGARKSGGKGVLACTGMRQRLLARFSQELDLTPEQQTEIKPILDKMTVEIENIHKEKRPIIRATIAACMAEIKKDLTPAQCGKLEKLEKRIGRSGSRGSGRGRSGAAGRGCGGGGDHRGGGRKKTH